MVGGALAAGDEGLGGLIHVLHFDGVEGVPGGADDAVVDEVVLAVEVEVLAEGLQAGMGGRGPLTPAGPGVRGRPRRVG